MLLVRHVYFNQILNLLHVQTKRFALHSTTNLSNLLGFLFLQKGFYNASSLFPFLLKFYTIYHEFVNKKLNLLILNKLLLTEIQKKVF